MPRSYLGIALTLPEITEEGLRAMAGRRSSKRHRKSANAEARRRRRVVGLGTSAGAFLAFGMTPLAAAPSAHADELELIIDPIVNSIAGSLGV